ncbi:hypothetical protein LTSEMON_5081 [Salmonella enterica subsp. enterica serovar Montevideo str. S5-403]|uniref:Uncharacterized protein n=2 Tax=Salmonella enterica I TaxID=59201 RepID=A0A1C9T8L8_SALET|nr:hypothetical protein [Salmonella enterica subsp. enterica serovar Indiana]EHC73848.1 hypothetical protein LTSEMON_5081 [Salmonella enterica subsp. enterica serovar Montevideo str. S5-403]
MPAEYFADKQKGAFRVTSFSDIKQVIERNITLVAGYLYRTA